MAAYHDGVRIASVDLLRGLVMVIMAIDHVRDYVHGGAMNFPPEDLTRTTAPIFLTRWITHICAPSFMLCAGLGAFLKLERDQSIGRLSWFLFTRGIWLVILEVTLVRLAFFFDFSYDLVFLLVFWVLGLGMIVLSVLVYLPSRVLLAGSIAVIAMHHLLDRVQATDFGAFGWAWNLLHQPGLVRQADPAVVVGYPAIPWIAVIVLGFAVGRVFRLPAERRRVLLAGAGVAMILAFVALRWLNAYGDQRPWTPQSTPLFTLLSFLNTSKYPPSLLFLLMTLGPAFVLLGLFERARPRDRHPLLVFGRTPLFYFIAHLALAHAAAIVLTWFSYGRAPFLFMPPPTVGSPRSAFPADYGWDLWVVYVVTFAIVTALYPVCLWLARLKAARRHWWLSYL
jgi:uncharacterized membrane protein